MYGYVHLCIQFCLFWIPFHNMYTNVYQYVYNMYYVYNLGTRVFLVVDLV
jgi:hypothetical protein